MPLFFLQDQIVYMCFYSVAIFSRLKKYSTVVIGQPNQISSGCLFLILLI